MAPRNHTVSTPEGLSKVIASPSMSTTVPKNPPIVRTFAPTTRAASRASSCARRCFLAERDIHQMRKPKTATIKISSMCSLFLTLSPHVRHARLVRARV